LPEGHGGFENVVHNIFFASQSVLLKVGANVWMFPWPRKEDIYGLLEE